VYKFCLENFTGIAELFAQSTQESWFRHQ